MPGWSLFAKLTAEALKALFVSFYISDGTGTIIMGSTLDREGPIARSTETRTVETRRPAALGHRSLMPVMRDLGFSPFQRPYRRVLGRSLVS